MSQRVERHKYIEVVAPGQRGAHDGPHRGAHRLLLTGNGLEGRARTLATGSCDATIRLWDLATRQTTTILTPHGGYVVSVAFSPDGRTLASAGTDRTVRLWDPATGHPTATLFGHTEIVFSVAFIPDGHTLATGSMDGTVRLWTPGDPP